MKYSPENILNLLHELNTIGIALSTEKNHDHLLELILVKAMDITNADGGTFYLKSDTGKLEFVIMHNRSLRLHRGGTSGEPIEYQPISLRYSDGKPNDKMVVTWVGLNKKTANIVNAYTISEFDFSGTRSFDKKMNYHSISFLTVPMINHENELIGVLQLINAIDENNGNIVPFTHMDQQLIESLASQAAVILNNQNLLKAEKELFNSFIQLIAAAIDEKSPYTAEHCRRVPLLVNMLAEAVCSIDKGPFKDFSMTEEEKYELEVAAWLHDCGKITTPEYIVDKGTKLETIFDRINLVDMRFEVLKRDAVINALKKRLDKDEDLAAFIKRDAALTAELQQLSEECDYIHQCNIGSESLPDEKIERIAQIAKRKTKWYANGAPLPLLTEEELQNLQIRHGTLNAHERSIINNHVSVTIKMLESLPYPNHLKRVPEYAGGHHEKIDGSGYPNKLKLEQMSVPARMLAIADIFEALTANDRPYKKAIPLLQALNMLGQMRIDRHIDPNLFDVFIYKKVYLDYAKRFLLNEYAVEAIDINKITGYGKLN